MQRRELIQRLTRAARQQNVTFTLVREGGRHSIYEFGGQQIAIPRHHDINERLALGILREHGA